MLRSLAVVLALVGVATSLQCHSCDSFISCSSPFPVPCPPNAKCYTLTRHGHEVIAKGCAHSCDSFSQLDGSHCQICHHMDYCNDNTPKIGQGVIMKSPPEIGGGVQPDNGYHIGHGVRPRSATQASFGFLMTLPVIRRFVL
ncbi:hypothetical protein CAEBREN_06936 [Caenorhabditis brenneri]|uniref:Uncharacterized protein n=1 Tax=Caenorhabditis brenneri TaxID=135651 RepID=G0NC63_CAEBE|nr:hypothetical protein CAEBREN_06936 [Caenorhabditis brenneri]